MTMNPMNFFVPVLVLLVCFLILSKTSWIRRFIEFRVNKGTLGRATLFDVKRLIVSGKSILAVRLYRKIYKGASRKEAQRAVEEMERSIKGKKNSPRT